MDVAEVFGLHGVQPGLRGQLRRRRALRGARGIHQHLDSTAQGLGFVQRTQRLRSISQIGRHRVHMTRWGVQRLLGAFQVVRVARHQRDARALGQKGLGTGQANAFAAASDQNMVVIELQVHGVSSSRLRCGSVNGFNH